MKKIIFLLLVTVTCAFNNANAKKVATSANITPTKAKNEAPNKIAAITPVATKEKSNVAKKIELVLPGSPVVLNTDAATNRQGDAYSNSISITNNDAAAIQLTSKKQTKTAGLVLVPRNDARNNVNAPTKVTCMMIVGKKNVPATKINMAGILLSNEMTALANSMYS